MNSRVVNISSLIILLSLLSFIAEALAYYLIPLHWVSILFAALLSLGISHFCLETSLDYDYGFIHAAFMTISTLAFASIVYLIQPNQWITYDFSLVFLMLINWIVPLLYNTIRDLLDNGPRFYGYSIFFKRMTILFLIIYIMVILKQYFITPITPPYEAEAFGAHNFVPFMSLGIHLEAMLRTQADLIPLHLSGQNFHAGNSLRFFLSDLLPQMDDGLPDPALYRLACCSGSSAGTDRTGQI